MSGKPLHWVLPIYDCIHAGDWYSVWTHGETYIDYLIGEEAYLQQDMESVLCSCS